MILLYGQFFIHLMGVYCIPCIMHLHAIRNRVKEVNEKEVPLFTSNKLYIEPWTKTCFDHLKTNFDAFSLCLKNVHRKAV